MVTPDIVNSLAEKEIESMNALLKKSPIRAAEENGMINNPTDTIQFFKTYTVEQMGQIRKQGVKSCRETYRKINGCAEQKDELPL